MKRCLIVDDSTVIRKVERRILEGLGFEVEEAGDGQQALDACLKSLPDAILLDWNMPVMTGIEFLQKLRRLPNGDQPRVLLCSTENDMSKIVEAIECGANEYVMKPFDNEIISGKLAQIGLI